MSFVLSGLKFYLQQARLSYNHCCSKFISKPRRFIPECIQFLNGILYLSIDWSSQTEKLTKYDMTTVFEVFRRSQMKLLINEKTYDFNTVYSSTTSHIDL